MNKKIINSIKVYNKSNKSDIKIFLKKITEKEFKINKNIKDAPWKYLNNKKFKYKIFMRTLKIY